jgi:hypothetical protein
VGRRRCPRRGSREDLAAIGRRRHDASRRPWLLHGRSLEGRLPRPGPRDPRYIVDPAHASTITEWAALGGDLTHWGVAAVLLGPVLGLVGAGTHRSDALGLACRLAVPTGAAVEMLAIHLPHAIRLEPRPVVLATTITVSLIAMLTAVAIVARHARPGSTSCAPPLITGHRLNSSDAGSEPPAATRRTPHRRWISTTAWIRAHGASRQRASRGECVATPLGMAARRSRVFGLDRSLRPTSALPAQTQARKDAIAAPDGVDLQSHSWKLTRRSAS